MPRAARVVGIECSRRPSSSGGSAGFVVGVLAAAMLISCEQPPPPAVAITVRARTESGAPVANAQVFYIDRMGQPVLVNPTDREGRVRLNITGSEGESFKVPVVCPPGYRSPTEPLEVRRFGIGATTSVPEYAVVCHETRHTMVVAVRAEGGTDLPVMYLGKEVARTDRSGAAHVTVAMDVHDRIELMIATSGKDNEKIHPQNPVSVFEMPDHDDFEVFPVTFTRDVKKAPPPARWSRHPGLLKRADACSCSGSGRR